MKYSSIAYLLGKEDYWHAELPVKDDLNPDDPLSYYRDMTPKAKYSGKFDEAGVFLRHHGTRWVYSPIDIANYALGSFQLYLRDEDEKAEKAFRAQLDWFISAAVEDDRGFILWPHDYAKPMYGLKKGWISAMAQGMAVSVLLRGWRIYALKEAHETALGASGAFYRSLEDGGVASDIEDGLIFYEEYPSDPPSHVLNGFIRSLLGLRDLALFASDENARGLYESGLNTLREVVGLYDTGYWTRYDLYDPHGVNLASPYYHRSHIIQMDLLHRLTGDKLFAETADRWTEYENNIPGRVKALWGKVIWKLFKKGRR